MTSRRARRRRKAKSRAEAPAPPPQAVATVPAPLGRWCTTGGKRLLDCLVAAVLLPLAAVLIALAALAVKSTSAGPVFYTQTRVGRNGQRFTILKLRTMRHGCEARTGPCWSLSGDSRVTRVGRFLRATHFDELPQLWNVLRGDMSLVGPRPERPEIIESEGLARLVPGYNERLSVRPGVTGLAQLLLPPDADVESVRRKVAQDLHYIENAGAWLDLRILFGTLLKAVGAGPRTIARCVAIPRPGEQPAPAPPGESSATDDQWRQALASACMSPSVQLVHRPVDNSERAAVRAWFRSTAVPALYELAAELGLQGRKVRVTVSGAEEAGLRVWHRGTRELDLKFRVRTLPSGVRVYARELVRDGRRDFVHEHTLDRPVGELTGAEVLAFVVARYQVGLARSVVTLVSPSA
jgi:lipopolysaccharide/colanic/teichoic acid biosynthesis glycosyltransferase